MAPTLTLAHSPDPDDAFMFYALARDRIPTDGLRFQQVLADIETLNQRARQSAYDITAISFHAYAYLHERYALLRCGSSFGDGYGPLIVAPAGAHLRPEQIAGKRIAVPGPLTTAALLLQLHSPGAQTLSLPFDQIPAAVAEKQVDAGVLIHEGQLTFAASGLEKVLDLGAWWKQQTGLPVPLGGDAVRRDLSADLVARIATVLRRSIQYALDHRPQALAYALGFGRGLSPELADRFVGMYVNRWTLDAGPDGLRALQLLLDRAADANLIPARVPVEFRPA
ncbi:MAG: menaquinone biosynthesis family protein [Terriglobia bacterium]